MDSYEALLDKDVYGSDDKKIGSVDALYVTEGSAEPLFATVSTGWFSGSSFIPLRDATVMDDKITVPYDKEMVKDAPNIEADQELTPDEEARLYSYYEMDNSSVDAADDGHDASGPTTDNAMTRSEEEVNIGTRTEETGRVRLKKYIVTDHVTKTVPVQREEIRVEREPVTDDNVEDAMDGPAISDEEHEVVTHGEVPVVEKRAVPKERVKLDKEVVSDEETVDEEVRKEQIDIDSDRR